MPYRLSRSAMSISRTAFRPSSILLIFDSEPRIALAAVCAEIPRDSRSRLNCVPRRIRRTVGATAVSARKFSLAAAAVWDWPDSDIAGLDLVPGEPTADE